MTVMPNFRLSIRRARHRHLPVTVAPEAKYPDASYWTTPRWRARGAS